ncbi:MAG: hypothetical protein LBS74_04135 [Oscillospiraceae bacterium]|jgi:hypothetical protein|nr:hypothetical protein [Oscillospiraceae bacterium]
MKKILIFAMVICLTFALASCSAKVAAPSSPAPVSSAEVTTTTTTVTTTVTTTSQASVATSKKQSATQIIANLVNEDGTGVIQPTMSLEQVATILNQYGILYQYSLDTPALNIESGMFYEVGAFAINQSKRGLKIGDPVSRVYELYEGAEAAYRVIEEGEKCAIFVFAYPNSQFRVLLNSDFTKVKSMVVGSL